MNRLPVRKQNPAAQGYTILRAVSVLHVAGTLGAMLLRCQSAFPDRKHAQEYQCVWDHAIDSLEAASRVPFNLQTVGALKCSTAYLASPMLVLCIPSGYLNLLQEVDFVHVSLRQGKCGMSRFLFGKHRRSLCALVIVTTAGGRERATNKINTVQRSAR